MNVYPIKDKSKYKFKLHLFWSDLLLIASDKHLFAFHLSQI